MRASGFGDAGEASETVTDDRICSSFVPITGRLSKVRNQEKNVDDGIESIAVGFLHSFRNPVHERAAAEAIAATLPDMDVSLSSAIRP